MLEGALKHIAQVLDDVGGRALVLDPKAIKTTNALAVKDFMAKFRGSPPHLTVPGSHGNISMQELAESLAARGSDFLQITVQMTQALRRYLDAYVDLLSRLCTVPELQRESVPFFRRWCAKRIQNGGEDILETPLTPDYAKYKRKKGKGGKPIGEWSGRFRRAVLNTLRVEWP